jgi:hypothetical protein
MKKEVTEVTAESLRFIKAEDKKRILQERKAWLDRERKNDRRLLLNKDNRIWNKDYRKKILARHNIYISKEIRLAYYLLIDKHNELYESF